MGICGQGGLSGAQWLANLQLRVLMLANTRQSPMAIGMIWRTLFAHPALKCIRFYKSGIPE